MKQNFSRMCMALVAMVIAIAASMMAQPADALLNISLKLTAPTTLDKTLSPRRIAVVINITFAPTADMLGPVNAWIPVTNWSTAAKFKTFAFSEYGIWYPATYTYSVTFRNAILARRKVTASLRKT